MELQLLKSLTELREEHGDKIGYFVSLMKFIVFELVTFCITKFLEVLIGLGSPAAQYVCYVVLLTISSSVLIALEKVLRIKAKQKVGLPMVKRDIAGNPAKNVTAIGDTRGEQHKIRESEDITPTPAPTTNTEGGPGHDDNHGQGSGPAADRTKDYHKHRYLAALRGREEQYEQYELTDNRIWRLAASITDRKQYLRLGVALNLPSNVLQSILSNKPDEITGASHDMLQTWRNRVEGSHFEQGKLLVAALQKAGLEYLFREI